MEEKKLETEKVGQQEQALMPGTSTGLTELSDNPEDLIATKKDTDAILDACKELTRAISDLTVEWKKWQKAGKF